MKKLSSSGIRLAALVALTGALLWGCGGAPPQDAQAPNRVAQLDRTSLTAGAEAKSLIATIHMGSPATEESWVASYGGDRLDIYATAFPTEEEAVSQFAAMQAGLGRGTSRYSAATAANIAQQPGFRMQDNQENKQIFNFQKGRWVIGVRAIAPDLEPAVFSIEWVDAK